MRILRIAGEGLASLVQPFEVDLRAEPLKGAGLFAITGPTGAGKSTILDAICLAIYGQYPRSGAAGNEKILDNGNEELSAGDERSILSKGCAAAYAEAEFRGIDGERYIARWQVRRARDRPDGKLQKVERSLARVADGGTEMLAAQTREMDRAVESITGFTFEQFRRTVLLAQGDVDAFLRARPRDRAALLDKITNTGIYAEISRRVHELCRAAEAGVERLEAELTGIGLMPTERREALDTERGGVGGALETHNAQRDHLDEQLRRHAQIRACREALEKARSDREAAIAVRKAAADAFEQVALLGKADGLRPLMRHLDATRAETEKCRLALASADAELANNVAAREAAAMLLHEREEEDRTSEQSFREMAGLWEEAAHLDGEISAAQSQTNELREKVNRHRTAAVDAAAAAQELQQRWNEAEKALRHANDDLKSREASGPLAENWHNVESHLPKRQELRLEAAALAEKLKSSARERSEIATRLDSGAADLANRRERIEALRDRLAAKSATLKAAENPALEARATSLSQLADRARLMHEAAAKHLATTMRLRDSERILQEVSGQLAKCREDAEAAEARLADARHRRGADQLLFDLAEAALSTQAVELRSCLVDGEPCPVCGSRSHQQPHETAELVAALRLRKAAIDAQLEEAEIAKSQALSQVGSAGSRREILLGQLAELRSEVSEAHHGYSRNRALFLADRRREDRDLTASVEPEPYSAKELIETIEERRALCRDKLKSAMVLRQERDELIRELDTLDREATHLADERNNLTERFSSLKEIAAAANERSIGLRDRIASIDRELKPLIVMLGLTELDLNRDPVGVATQLTRLVEEFRLAADRAMICERQVGEIRPQAVEGRAWEDRVMAQLREYEGTLVEREEGLEALRIRRAAMLGGEDTATHRARISEFRSLARDAFKLAEARHGVARSNELATASRVSSLTALLSEARSRQEQAAAAVANGRLAASLSVAELEKLVAVPEAEVASIRARVAEIIAAVERTELLISERERDLIVALAPGEVASDPEALKARKVSLGDEIEQLQRRLGEIAGILKADDENRRTAGDLEDRIALARQEAVIWREVSEAVGSADGSKFQRFAQGVTLAHLVHLANHHLSDLNPRYRLEIVTGGDLGLQIVDLEQDEARRSTVSLSGGERFLTSLALALALSGLEGRMSFVDTLFIDEGFGSLDVDTLDVAIDALERLHGKGRKVGVISHVEAMHERIPVQIRVEKRGNGRSIVRVEGGVVTTPAPDMVVEPAI